VSLDAFIAIDWSGAAPGYSGIAVARCGPGDAAPRLVRPPARRWTRTAVAQWLGAEFHAGLRTLVGFDFAFAMPYETEGYLAGCGARDAFALWDLIETASGDEADFGAAAVPADPRFAPCYWTSGAMPGGWKVRRRQTELACASATGTYPETVFKLIGAKQVGKASLTGMRVINHLRRRHAGRVSVWPFEKAPVRAEGGSVLVEIYPTLFRKQAGHGTAKLRSLAELNRGLRALGSQPLRTRSVLTDHDTDALISAAGLRRLWDGGYRCDEVDAQIRQEGWIFGVPFPEAAKAAA
jgi:hypothetical protein